MTFAKSAIAVPLILCLAACGGGGESEEFVFLVPPSVAAVVGENSGKTYSTLNATTTQTSELAGTTLVVNETDNTIELVTASGALNHSTGEITINNGVITLTDPNGVDGAGVLTNGMLTADYTQIGDFLALMDLDFTNGGDDYYAHTVGGIVTRPEDVPTRAVFSYYNGTAVGAVLTETEQTLITGDATGYVQFGDGTISLRIEDITATTLDHVPTDTLIRDIWAEMTISGNSFEGDFVRVSAQNGVALNLTGPNTESQAKGNFFGLHNVSNNQYPEEFGGIVLVQGDDGVIFTDFVGQQ